MRGERKEEKFHFGHAEFNVPTECSRGWVGLELKSKVGKCRFKNIKLKVVNGKKKGLLSSCREFVQTEIRIHQE